MLIDMITKNAIILAAGKSRRFAPFTYEKPKGLFRVKNEVLIERQIEQLREAGIQDIYIIVGYMKEKFFYLEEKYGIHLIVNNKFTDQGNVSSVYVCKEYLSNTFICCADQYFVENPFLDANPLNNSYRACTIASGEGDKYTINYSDAGVITQVYLAGEQSTVMVGHAYFNEQFSKKFIELFEEEKSDFRTNSMFWEEFYAKHINALTLYKKDYELGSIYEFDSIDDLRQFDSEFLMNVDSDIITNICSVLKCEPNIIQNIKVINAGLTNVSFAFSVLHKRYVYRHPGGTARNLVDRDTEYFSQIEAKKAGLDPSVIYIDPQGWKLSYYVPNMMECNFEKYPWQLDMAMEYLHILHNIEPNKDCKVFDNVEEGKLLMTIASGTKGNLFVEFAEMVEKAEKIQRIVELEAARTNRKKVLCHNDVYTPNFIATQDKRLYLIDWEYAGINDEANDIASILCRGEWSHSDVERYLKAYMGRELTEEEHKYYMAYIVLCAFYWFCWGLYKGSVGDDDGFFFLPAYHSFYKYVDQVLESYE